MHFFYRLDQYAKQTSKFVEESTYLNLGGQTSNDNLGNVVNVSDFQVRLYGLYELFTYFPSSVLTLCSLIL